MALGYISPTQMAEYRQSVTRFAKGAGSLKCIRSHYLPEANGECDLTKVKEHSEIFVLANRVGGTMKVSPRGMQIAANVVDIIDADQWYEHLKEQRRVERERSAEEARVLEEKKKASRVVLFKRKPVELLEKNKNS